MRWPWQPPKETAKTVEHTKEIADVKERLDVIEDEIAVLQQNGDEA